MLVTVIGGSGFVGRHVVKALASAGHRVRVACRRPDLAGFVTTAGAIGQIGLVQANVRFPASIEASIEGADVVVNCVGLLHETGKQKFDALQADGAKLIADLAAQHGARVVHLSAIGADASSQSDYARSKALGEAAVLAHKGNVVLRPSIIFGAEDKFLNRFAAMATLAPVIPLVGAETKFQPVFVGDVALMVVKAVEGNLTQPIYELGGAEVLSFKDIITQMLAVIGRNRVVLPLPFPVAKIAANFLQFVPTTPLTPDQVILLASDNVVAKGALGLSDAGITPRRLADIMPSYLWKFRKGGQFNPLSQAA